MGGGQEPEVEAGDHLMPPVGGSSHLLTTSGGGGVSEDSTALVARHGWRASWPSLMIAGLLAVAIALSLVVVTMSPQDQAAFGVVLLVSIFVVWLLLLEALFLVLGGVFLGLLFVLAARRAIALSIEARGITLGALPLRRWVLLGQQRRDVRAAGADRFIPWSEVAAVHLPDTTRAWSGFWGAALGVLRSQSMTPGLAAPWGLSVEVRRRDGTSARRAMRGVGYDAFGFAEAVRRYAPDVLVTVEGQIN